MQKPFVQLDLLALAARAARGVLSERSQSVVQSLSASQSEALSGARWLKACASGFMPWPYVISSKPTALRVVLHSEAFYKRHLRALLAQSHPFHLVHVKS